MRARTTLRTLVSLSIFAGVSVIAAAQEPQKDRPRDQQERQRMDATSLTGCLAKGTMTDQYVLTDKAGTTTTVTASAGVGLEKHAGHTVALTGKKNAEGTFVATNVKHISPTCEAQK